MDPQVLIRFVEFLDNTFSRINSKRLISLLFLLCFLCFSRYMTPEAAELGFWATMVVLGLFILKPNGSDSSGFLKPKTPKEGKPGPVS